MAASKAATTVIDAANSVEVSRFVTFYYVHDILKWMHALLHFTYFRNLLHFVPKNVRMDWYRSQNNSNTVSSADTGITVKEMNEQTEDFFIPDFDSLTQLREKYCIQCLEILGEYVEVLGPVLREKGIDVCLTLLQRSSKHGEASNAEMLLADVMKLICALAAHRKFAALFVDRGGMQKLLAVPRVAQTFFGLSSCLFTIGSLQVPTDA